MAMEQTIRCKQSLKPKAKLRLKTFQENFDLAFILSFLSIGCANDTGTVGRMFFSSVSTLDQ